MEAILSLNQNKYGKILESGFFETIPKMDSQETFQAVIVHADQFYAVNQRVKLDELVSRIDSDRLIEARFFNENEEYRILRTFVNGETRFLVRHMVDEEDQADCDYQKSVDTSADFYKNGSVLHIRNYIRKRGLVNSYDDLRFVKLESK